METLPEPPFVLQTDMSPVRERSATISPARFAVLFVAFAGGCVAPNETPPFVPIAAIPPPPTVSPRYRQPTGPQQLPEPRVYFPWLEINAFFPPRCRRIVPEGGYSEPDLVATPRALFPSTAECVSPDGAWTLFHEAIDWSDGFDYLVKLRNNRTSTVRVLLNTRRAMEVLWSPDSRLAAISIIIGQNRSSVQIFSLQTETLSKPIAPAPALAPYFSGVQQEAPQYVMALRWTKDRRLILRAQGTEPVPPNVLFGYEVLVEPSDTGLVRDLKFLRGYTKAADPSAKTEY